MKGWLVLLVAALIFAAPRAIGAETFELRRAIFEKLDYDRSYFESIVHLQAQGRIHPALTPEAFEREVARARTYVPFLEKVFTARAAFEKGEALPLPGVEEPYRVYRNLVVLLDMSQAAEQRRPEAVLAQGKQASIRSTRDLGLVRADDDRYYLALYREFFFLMAQASYQLGRDSEAVAWLARVEGEAEVQALRKRLALDQKADTEREDRVALLRTKPIAVVPLEAVNAQDPEAAWLGAGLAETIANDLVQATDLLVVERSQVQRLLGEAWLAKSGLTDPRTAARLGEMLSAGSLVVGSWRRAEGKTTVTLRLADAADGRVIASAERSGAGDPFALARETLVEVLTAVGFVGDASAAAIRGVNLPRPDGLRELLQARLALGRDPAQARALYASAARKDPAMARAFADLRSQFANVTQVIAVTPPANVSGSADDLWMVQGAVEALSTDLPKLGFTVTERAQLAALLKQVQLGQLLDANLARAAGQKLDADFIVVGSVLHQAPRVRVECRFVEVRTAIVVVSASADGTDGEYAAVLGRLVADVARRFNERLSEKTLSELMGHRMSPQSFERFARQELAGEALRRQAAAAAPVAPKQSVRSRPPFWPGVLGAVAGAGTAAAALVLAGQHQHSAGYAEAALALASRPEDVARLTRDRDDQARLADRWRLGALGGAGVAALSVGYLVYRELRGRDRPAPAAMLFLAPVPGGAVAALSLSR